MQLVKYDKPTYIAIAIATSPNASRTVTLMPGFNELPDKEWLECKKSPEVQSLIEEGIIEEVVGKRGDQCILLAMTQDDAMKTVEATFDTTLLQRWLGQETRVIVTRLISQKLKGIYLPDRLAKAGLDEETDETPVKKNAKSKAAPKATVKMPKAAFKMSSIESRTPDRTSDNQFEDEYPRADKKNVELVRAPKNRRATK